MAKTAEEFVMERYDLTKHDMKNEDLLRVSGVDIAQDIDDYAGEFAAQEVEAYKERLKLVIEEAVEDKIWTLQHALTLIQLTK